MLIKEKILVELDVPTVSGLIYPKELSVDIMRKIETEIIGGIIYNNGNIPNPENIVPKFQILNAKVVVDETPDIPELIIVCDVQIDESVLTDDELYLLDNYPWRLNIIGKGSVENNIIKNYDLKYVNIEIVDYLD